MGAVIVTFSGRQPPPAVKVAHEWNEGIKSPPTVAYPSVACLSPLVSPGGPRVLGLLMGTNVKP